MKKCMNIYRFNYECFIISKQIKLIQLVLIINLNFKNTKIYCCDNKNSY
jgi:hypothetical protein